MGQIIKEETIKFVNKAEYDSVKSKLESEPKYESIRKIIEKYDDETFKISYKTEEIIPQVIDENRIKVLLLFKNPHPDSVKAGLYLSEPSSKKFWDRFFEVEFNEKLIPLLQNDSWVKDVADTLTSGNYECEFLYYFKCLYPFPSRQFNELTDLFSSAPRTYNREIEKRSITDFWEFINKHKIANVITFFIDGMRLLTRGDFENARHIISKIKKGIDEYGSTGKRGYFWNCYEGLKKEVPGKAHFYFNMNTRTKNHGVHLPKRYFTYNLEFILQDILGDSEQKAKMLNAVIKQDSKGESLMNSIWYVVHHRNLWDIDKNLIGFWNETQMDHVSEGDYIIYYRAGYKKIMGVFKAGKKGINLNKDFHDDAIIEKLIYQCRMELVSNDVICGRPTTEKRFSFFDEWRRHRYGGLKKQIFRANYEDIKLILCDPTVVK